MQPPIITFENTRQALAEFDATQAARDKAWTTVETAMDVLAAETTDRVALRKVQEAFYKDTMDINSLDHCYLADIGFMRYVSRKGQAASS